MENKTAGLEALEKAKDIISDYSGAYMNENVPESEIYGIRKEKYKEYAEKDNMLYNQLDIVEKELNKSAEYAKIAHLLNEKDIDIHLVKTSTSEDEYNEILMKQYGSFAPKLYLNEEEFKEVKSFFEQMK